jgi:TPP-dependent pyruvate/acetoin dehydrogenase alpha subunit
MFRPECLALPTDISPQAGLFGVLLSSVVAEGMDVLAVETGVKQAADFIAQRQRTIFVELRT